MSPGQHQGTRLPTLPAGGPLSRDWEVDVNTLESGRSDPLADQGVHALTLQLLSPSRSTGRAPCQALLPPHPDQRAASSTWQGRPLCEKVWVG